MILILTHTIGNDSHSHLAAVDIATHSQLLILQNVSVDTDTWWCVGMMVGTDHPSFTRTLTSMGIIADHLKSHLERIEELDRQHQQLIDDFLQDTKKFLHECEQLTKEKE